jgi:hypothetical protein
MFQKGVQILSEAERASALDSVMRILGSASRLTDDFGTSVRLYEEASAHVE